HRAGAIDRVIVLGKSEDQTQLRVLNIDALAKNPQLLKRYGSSYSYATVFWNVVSAIVLVGSIIVSFMWYWWLFIVGFVVAIVIHRSNKASVADFVQEII